jgi:hypothetical protein
MIFDGLLSISFHAVVLNSFFVLIVSSGFVYVSSAVTQNAFPAFLFPVNVDDQNVSRSLRD